MLRLELGRYEVNEHTLFDDLPLEEHCQDFLEAWLRYFVAACNNTAQTVPVPKSEALGLLQALNPCREVWRP